MSPSLVTHYAMPLAAAVIIAAWVWRSGVVRRGWNVMARSLRLTLAWERRWRTVRAELREYAHLAHGERTRELRIAAQYYGMHLTDCSLSRGAGHRIEWQHGQVGCTCNLELTINPVEERGESGRYGYALVDRAMVIYSVTNRFAWLTGYSANELIGRDILSLIPTRYHEEHAKAQERYQVNPAPRVMGTLPSHVVLVRQDGRELPVDIGLQPMVASEGPVTLVLARQRHNEPWW